MIHQAGPLHRGTIQCCLRCGYILTDYTGAMVPEADVHEGLAGWAVGAFIDVEDLGGMTQSLVTQGPATCPESTEYLAANGKPIDGYPRQQA